MTTTELLDLLRQAYDGDPWHGPSLEAVLTRVSAEHASVRPLSGRHTVWETVLHLTAWTRETERRVRTGAPPAQPAEGDWPPTPVKPTRAAWTKALRELETAHRSLEQTVANAPRSRWAAIVRTPEDEPRDPALGTGYSYGTMIVGLATHYAYHAGQIALLAPPPATRKSRRARARS
jgi:DinB family protein